MNHVKIISTLAEKCDRCGTEMIDIQVCHLLCPKCGAVLDCSDKGSAW